ncbi:hypothetical protein NXY55_10150 [Aeromonas veronii]|nr:hypothetical protein [Aeromonas veronii]
MTIKREGNSQSESFTIDHIQLQVGSKYYAIEDVLEKLTITESLDGMMIGELIIGNKIGFFDQQDVMGNDNILRIKMKSTSKHKAEGKTFERVFRVYHYSDTFSHQSATGYAQLLFKSIGAVNNNFKRVSKSYKSVGTHIIVADMLKLIGYEEKEINVEPTMYNRDIVIPNITPLDAIDFLKNHSVSGETKHKGDSAFYMFESRDKVNFVSRSALVSKDPIAKYAVGLDAGGLNQNVAISFTLDSGFNIESQASEGAYGLTVVSHSLLDKSISHVRMTPDKIEGVYSKMNEQPATNVEYSPSNRIVIASEDQMYKFQNMGANGNTIAIREMNKSRIKEKRALMQVGADSDMTVGEVIDITFDGAGGQSKNSSKWLIGSVVHRITKQEWITDLELFSDGSPRPIVSDAKPKPKDEKKDK